MSLKMDELWWTNRNILAFRIGVFELKTCRYKNLLKNLCQMFFQLLVNDFNVVPKLTSLLLMANLVGFDIT